MKNKVVLFSQRFNFRICRFSDWWKKVVKIIRHGLVIFAIYFWGNRSFREAKTNCLPNTIYISWIVLNLILDKLALRCSYWLFYLVFKIFVSRPVSGIISSTCYLAPLGPRFNKLACFLSYARIWLSVNFNWSDRSMVVKNLIEKKIKCRRCNMAVPMRKVLDILRGWGHCLGLVLRWLLTHTTSATETSLKNVTAHRLNIYRYYSTSFNLSNVGEFVWSWIINSEF